MTPGIYQVKFVSNVQGEGWGVITVDSGRLHGCDMNYLYKGRFQVDGGKVTAQVQASNYTGQLTSVFGLLNIFDLNLAGTASAGTFNLSGNMHGRPDLRITISGTKKLDLA